MRNRGRAAAGAAVAAVVCLGGCGAKDAAAPVLGRDGLLSTLAALGVAPAPTAGVAIWGDLGDLWDDEATFLCAADHLREVRRGATLIVLDPPAADGPLHALDLFPAYSLVAAAGGVRRVEANVPAGARAWCERAPARVAVVGLPLARVLAREGDAGAALAIESVGRGRIVLIGFEVVSALGRDPAAMEFLRALVADGAAAAAAARADARPSLADDAGELPAGAELLAGLRKLRGRR